MSGYTTGTPQITILQDYVDADLTLFTEKLVDTYCDIGYTRAICGYGYFFLLVFLFPFPLFLLLIN